MGPEYPFYSSSLLSPSYTHTDTHTHSLSSSTVVVVVVIVVVFVAAAAGAAAAPLGAAGLSAPALSQGAAARTLRFVPQANLANFDPIWGTQYVVRNASAMVWDLLYGVDDKLEAKPQMVEGDEVSPDGLVWTFKLREGLRFHDNEPVLAKDAVASIQRWMSRWTAEAAFSLISSPALVWRQRSESRPVPIPALPTQRASCSVNS